MLKHIKQKETKEFYTSERCHISELLNDADVGDISMARCRVEPGVRTQLHSLTGTKETYLIESGTGVMDDGGAGKIEVVAGDSVAIPAGHPQRILNTGNSDLVFVVICRPRFLPECYVDLETAAR